MRKNRKPVAIVTGLLALVLLLSVGATSLFASDTSAGIDAKQGFLHKMMGYRGNFNNPGSDKMFEKLVTDGVLTQEQADQIAAYQTSKAEERKTEFEKIKDMTAEERKAYLEANKPLEKPELFANLVSAGIITQEKADEIAKLLPAKPARPLHDGQCKQMMRGKRNSQ